MNRRQKAGDTNTLKRSLILSRIIGILSLALVPNYAFASQQSILPSEPETVVTQAIKRDPYLAEAIDNLPNYTYLQAGNALAIASPRTKLGDWPALQVETSVEIVPTSTPTAQPIASQSGSVLVLQGEASYYSRAGCLGCNPALHMANGQTLDDHALTMAIGANLKHLVGHQAKVTSLATGKSVNVRITDTGGFYQAKYGNRVADLTIATKNAIGMAGGVGQVRVEVF